MNNCYSISVIIPVYNVKFYVADCVKSVMMQTVTNDLECIVVDDCGFDNSMEIVESLILDYHGEVNFRILRHNKNLGLSAARNTGIKHAKGDYLLFLDSDDELLPNAIECFLKKLEQHIDVDMIQGAYKSEIVEKRYKNVALPDYTNDKKTIKTLMLDYDKVPIMAQNRLVKRKLIEEKNLYFKEGIIHEDCYWTFFLAKYVNSLACLQEKTYYYRVNPNSITGKPNREKETNSFRVIIKDFSANIDSFQQGTQKTLIWYLLLQVLGNGYYNGQEDKKQLFQCLYRQCSWFEKIFMHLWYILSDGSWVKRRLVNVVIRFFQI